MSADNPRYDKPTEAELRTRMIAFEIENPIDGIACRAEDTYVTAANAYEGPLAGRGVLLTVEERDLLVTEIRRLWLAIPSDD